MFAPSSATRMSAAGPSTSLELFTNAGISIPLELGVNLSNLNNYVEKNKAGTGSFANKMVIRREIYIL
jgi:hypothetical protein